MPPAVRPPRRRGAAGARRSPAPAWPARRRPPRPSRPADAHVPPVAGTARAGRPEPRAGTSDPPLPQARRQRLDQRRHAAVEGPEERRPVGVRCGDLGAQRPHEAASALGGRQERREGRGGGHVVDRAGVDAADEGVDQDVDDPLAELARHERPDGAVADRPPDVGPGQHGIAGEAERAADAEDAGAGGRPEPGGDARAPGPRAACAGARGPTPTRPAPRWARVRRRAPPRGTGRRPRAGGRGTRRGPCRRRARRGPRCAAGRRGARTPRAATTAGASAAGSAPPVSSQAAARPLMPPPTTTTRRGVTSGAPSAATITSASTAMKTGSSLSEAVRA